MKQLFQPRFWVKVWQLQDSLCVYKDNYWPPASSLSP
jgi:hypothetical protein